MVPLMISVLVADIFLGAFLGGIFGDYLASRKCRPRPLYAEYGALSFAYLGVYIAYRCLALTSKVMLVDVAMLVSVSAVLTWAFRRMWVRFTSGGRHSALIRQLDDDTLRREAESQRSLGRVVGVVGAVYATLISFLNLGAAMGAVAAPVLTALFVLQAVCFVPALIMLALMLEFLCQKISKARA